MHSIFPIYLPFLFFEAYFWWWLVIIAAKAIIVNCCCCPSTFKKKFNWRLITLQYHGGFCHTSTWISHGCTCVPHPEPPSHLSPHPIPQGHPSAPALSALSHALTWTGDLFHIWYYTCFNDILSNHPTLAFSHRVQNSVPYICVSFVVSHTGLSLPSF